MFVSDKGKLHQKQEEALYILTDSETEEFAYGGAAGGAKSWTGCLWLLFMCLAYPGTRWFIGREELKRLRESTYQTFLKLARKYGLKQGEDWFYNGQDHYIHFPNGSRIDFLDLKYVPRDPLYERYGSVEYTGGWIEEGGEVNFGAYDTLKSRVGRQLNEKYGIMGKIFVTLNPKKNWCHTEFWKPFKAGILPKHKRFLQALVQDNPFIDAGYIDKLHKIVDKVKKQRLLYGNFDYDDDDNALMTYDAITDIFSNGFVVEGKKYITADVARFGSDRSVIMVWNGLRVIDIVVLKQQRTTKVADEIEKIRNRHGIPISSVIVDEDGVGGGVVDKLRCQGFVNNSSPLPNPVTQEQENYKNLKSQCYYMLAERINDHKIFVSCEDTEIKEALIEELEQVKKREVDNDKKLEVVPKDEVKDLLGRSPDYSDTLMMRMFFELKPKMNWQIY
ncbi:Terminase-like family protein [Chitinophaga eiseniae]|uniref:Terminase-like family protein n=2 Tax=Chitinophaga eiseniae TaxID=634771 RepID=A0A1T4SP08_9BACT|nr:Terminase-like family protein [Chitinophaga eiseniae]